MYVNCGPHAHKDYIIVYYNKDIKDMKCAFKGALYEAAFLPLIIFANDISF